MNTKTAQEIAEQMLTDADNTGSATYDSILLTRNEDGTYAEGDNGDGDETSEQMDRESAKAVLINDITGSVEWLEGMTDAIYSIVSGADNTDEIDATQSEISDWLTDGDLDGSETAEQLAAEYIEYCSKAE